MTTKRTYRFAPLDSTGWLYGLSASQCISLAIGIFASGLALNAHLPVSFVIAPLPIALVFAFLHIGGRSTLGLIELSLRRLSLRFSTSSRWSVNATAFPPFLDHIEIYDFSATQNGDTKMIGIAIDHSSSTISTTILASSPSFVLCERDDQVRMLDAWMGALAPFATERRSITRISWTHRRGSYQPTHTTAITLTARTRTSQLRSLDDDSTSADIATLLRETDSLARRLVDAGLIVSAPLSALELRQQLSAQLDTTRPPIKRTLALVTANYRNPMSSGAIATDHVCCGSTFHRSYWVESWPRHELEPDWLESLLLSPVANFTFTVICEPVAPSASRRTIDRKATKLATDAEQRSRAGFRVGQEHENASIAIAAREVELASGHVEFAFVGIVSVNATSEETLRNSCAELEHAVATTGIALRSLDGHHDEALTYALPVGAAPKDRRIS